MADRTAWCLVLVLGLGCGSKPGARGGGLGEGGTSPAGAESGGSGGRVQIAVGGTPMGGAAGVGGGMAGGGKSPGGVSGAAVGGASGAAMGGAAMGGAAMGAAAGSKGSSGGSPFEGLSEKPDVDTTPVASCEGQPDLTLCQVTTTPDRSYDICVAGKCVSPGCGDLGCNVPAPHFMIPPSGGPLYLSLHAGQEPVVVDLVTGLDWQGCVAGRSGETCDTGQQTNLSWDDALAYCDGLTWAGKDDWYLPDAYELLSLLDYAVVVNGQSSATNLAIDQGLFPNSAGAGWTSHYTSDQNVFYVEFQPGLDLVPHLLRSDKLAVRCARRGFSRAAGYAGTRFATSFPASNDEKVVEDPATGLVWQGCLGGRSGDDCSLGTTLELKEADWMAQCDSLTWAGYDDWRLPTWEELFSIAQYPRSGGAITPAIDQSIFDVGPQPYVASTNGPGPNEAGYLFDVGEASRVIPTGTYPVMCVRWK